MVLYEEQVAFSDWINTNLENDRDVGHLLKLNVRTNTYLMIMITQCRRRVLTCMTRWMMVFFCVR